MKPLTDDFKQLIDRWKSVDVINFFNSPFGKTKDNLNDFRGFILIPNDSSQIQQLSAVNCDFSFARFFDLSIKESSFSNCFFDYAILTNFSDTKCAFVNTSFYMTEFIECSIGNNTTVYNSCKFVDVKYIDTFFENPLFSTCTFTGSSFPVINSSVSDDDDSNLNHNCFDMVDFNVSGFMDCKFSGYLNNIVFSGKSYDDNLISHHRGLYRCDFSKAILRNIFLINGCPVQNLVLPDSGETILISKNKFLELLPIINDLIAKHKVEINFNNYLTVIEENNCLDIILSLYDFINLDTNIFSPDNENLKVAEIIYANILKNI